ncbi:MAG: hypothetical protein ACT4PT_01925, partial [Methanobacteriota archaeon]
MGLRRILGLAERRGPVLVAAAVLLAVAAGVGAYLVSPGPADSAPVLRFEDENATADGGAAVADADADGLADLLENLVYGSDPRKASTGGSGLPDGWLADHGVHPLDPDAATRPAAAPPTERLPAVYAGAYPGPYRLNLSAAYEHGLDPREWEAPDTGLPAGWLLYYGVPVDAPGVGETRGGSRLTVRESYENDTDPRRADSDGDGLDDLDEIRVHGTLPSRRSTSGSGIADGWLVTFGFSRVDPGVAAADPDRDGLTNLEEYAWSAERFGPVAAAGGAGLSPARLVSGTTGIPDGWFVRYGLDPLAVGVEARVTERAEDARTLVPGARREIPSDAFLTVADEYRAGRPSDWSEARDGPWWGGTDPGRLDTDGDGLPDLVEVVGWPIDVTLGLGPTAASRRENVTADAREPDADRDGLSDVSEFLRDAGTDPRTSDTDFDGLLDGEETGRILRDGVSYEPGTALSPVRADSVGSYAKDGARFELWHRRLRTASIGTYAFAADHTWASLRDVLRTSGAAEAAAASGRVLSDSDLLSLLSPLSDLDGDAVPNLLDADADNDTLPDGWEMDPTWYSTVDPGRYALGATRPDGRARAATDPANGDTDGDGLPDAWEIGYGVFDAGRGRFDLDPSERSSLGRTDAEGRLVLDADADYDGDGIRWRSFTREPDGRILSTERVYAHTNRQEFLAKGRGTASTDPHRADTNGDGVVDGWGAFWGLVYPDLPSADRGSVAPTDAAIAARASRLRPLADLSNVSEKSAVAVCYSDSTDRGTALAGCRFPNASRLAVTSEGASPGGGTRFTVRLAVTFRDEAEAGTNPYVDDTDGDAMPDAWEILFGLAPADAGADDALRGPAGDLDGDGLANRLEFSAGSNPRLVDTDRGGVPDGGDNDPAAPPDTRIDVDHDGLPTASAVDPKEGDADLDRDGLLDGPNRLLRAGVAEPDGSSDAIAAELSALGVARRRETAGLLFLGEASAATDARDADSAEAGIPDGWQAFHGVLRAPIDGKRAAYEYARPTDWREATHGVWWWGLAPDPDADVDGDGRIDAELSETGLVVRDPDLDSDGLSDDPEFGEDPIPAASHNNTLPSGNVSVGGTTLSLGDPFAPGLPPLAALVRAQGYGDSLEVRARARTFDADMDRVPDADDRATPRFADVVVQLPATARGHRLDKERAFEVTGRLLVDEVGGTRRPVPDAAVLLGANGVGRSRAIGGAVTDADGRFRLTGNLTGSHALSPLPSGVRLFGAEGSVSWTAAEAVRVRPGDDTAGEPNRLLLWSQNTTTLAPPRYSFRVENRDLSGSLVTHPAEALRGAVSDALPVTVFAGAALRIEAPVSAASRVPFEARVVAADSSGAPLSGATVRVEWTGGRFDNMTPPLDANGRAVFTARDDGTVALRLVADRERPGSYRLAASADATPFTPAAAADAAVRLRFPATIELRVDRDDAPVGSFVNVTGRILDARSRLGIASPVRVSVGDAALSTESDGAGGFSGRLVVPSSLPPGLRPVSAATDATETHEPAAAAVLVRVLGESRVLGLAPRDLAVGETLEVAGRVASHLGTPLSGAVTLREGAVVLSETRADPEGHFSFRFTPPPEMAGRRDFTVAFEGARDHAPGAALVQVRIQQGSTLTATAPATAVRGEPLTVEARLVDEASRPVPGADIRATIGTRPVADGVSDDRGRLRLVVPIPANLSTGPATLSFAFSPGPSSAVRESRATVPITVAGRPVITLSPVRGVLGSDVLVEGVVRDDGGLPLARRAVLLRLDGTPLAAGTADDSGRFRIVSPLPPETRIGLHSITATVAANGTDAAAEATTEAVLRSVVRVGILLPDVLPQTGPFVLEGRLSSTEIPDPEGEVVARVGADEVARAPVGPGGAFRLEAALPPGRPLGPATLVVSYEPAGFAAPAAVTREVEVRALPVVLLTVPDRARPGDEIEGTLSIVDAEGRPVPDARVLVSGVDAVPVLVATDKEGRARFRATAPSEGPVLVSATFRGGEGLAPQVATASIAVVPAAPPGAPGFFVATA